MSDEEKKAIEYLKRHILPYYGSKGKIEFMLNDIILNLIDNQQKEIERLEARKYMFNAITGEISQIPVDNNYISKDKIRAKIEEYKRIEEKDIEVDTLQKLLEE